MLRYLETDSTDPAYNLAFEELVLERRREGDYLLLWQNAPTAVIGLNQIAAAEVDTEYAAAHGIAVVRRSTGGGAVYHDAGNLNYSLIGDAGDAAALSLARFMQPVCAALRSLGVPAEVTGRNDIAVEGRKVSGTAQRLSGGRVLHHGTLLFETDSETMSAVLRPGPGKFESKAAKSVRSRVGQIRDYLPPEVTLAGFRSALLAALGGEGLERGRLTDGELAAVERLAEEKYRSPDWTWGRAPLFGFSNERRFAAGTLAVSLDVEEGVIRAARISGDFLAVVPCTPAEETLRGAPFERAAAAAALAPLDLPPMLGGMGAEELLSLMF